MMSEFSQSEIELFLALGYTSKYIEIWENNPVALYRVAIQKCFIENLVGPPTEALRRATKHLIYDGKYRGNDEFDSLIRLE